MRPRRNSLSIKNQTYPLPRYDTTTHTKVAVSLATFLPGEIANMIILPPLAPNVSHTDSGQSLIASSSTSTGSVGNSNHPLNARLGLSLSRTSGAAGFPSATSCFHQLRRKHRGNGRKPERFLLQTQEEWSKPPYSGAGRPTLTLISLSTEASRRTKREYNWFPQKHYSVMNGMRWNTGGLRADDRIRTTGNERVWAFAILLDLEIDAPEPKDLRLTLSAGSGHVKLNARAWGNRETRVWWIRREMEKGMGEEHKRFWEIMDAGRRNRQICWREIHVDLEPEKEGGGWANLYRAELAVYVC